MGSGTTAVACARHGREFVGYEINADYHAIAQARVAETSLAVVPVERPVAIAEDASIDQA
jgi:site-specific DNA-methyltransferase (adenine-specific)